MNEFHINQNSKWNLNIKINSSKDEALAHDIESWFFKMIIKPKRGFGFEERFRIQKSDNCNKDHWVVSGNSWASLTEPIFGNIRTEKISDVCHVVYGVILSKAKFRLN